MFIIGVSNYSAGANFILAKNSIKNLSELSGKKVGVERGAIEEFLLSYALSKQRMSLLDIHEVDIAAQNAIQALKDGLVDAVVAYEPISAEEIAAADSYKIFTSAEAPGLVTNTVVFNSAFLSKNPQIAKAVLRAYFKSIDLIVNNRALAYMIGAKYFKITPYEFQQSLAGLKFLDEKENNTALSHMGGNESLYANSKLIVNFLREHGIITNEIDIEKFIRRQFFKEVYGGG